MCALAAVESKTVVALPAAEEGLKGRGATELSAFSGAEAMRRCCTPGKTRRRCSPWHSSTGIFRKVQAEKRHVVAVLRMLKYGICMSRLGGLGGKVAGVPYELLQRLRAACVCVCVCRSCTKLLDATE